MIVHLLLMPRFKPEEVDPDLAELQCLAFHRNGYFAAARPLEVHMLDLLARLWGEHMQALDLLTVARFRRGGGDDELRDRKPCRPHDGTEPTVGTSEIETWIAVEVFHRLSSEDAEVFLLSEKREDMVDQLCRKGGESRPRCVGNTLHGAIEWQQKTHE